MGCVMQGVGVSCRGGVGHAGVWWGGSCRGGVGHVGVDTNGYKGMCMSRGKFLKS